MSQDQTTGLISPRRVSIFREILDDDDALMTPQPTQKQTIRERSPRPPLQVRFRSKASIINNGQSDSEWEDVEDEDEVEAADPLETTSRTVVVTPVRSRMSRKMYRLGILVLLVAVSLPLMSRYPLFGAQANPLFARPIHKKDNSPTDICKRWSHQTALVNGTLYIYGGHKTTDPQQTDNTWTNDFLTMDLTKTWQISTPSMNSLPQPSGPPAVSNGYLWNSHTSLYLYGGEFSDTPATSPSPASLWEYDIQGQSWKEHQNPQTSGGNNAEPDGQSVGRVAEGAGFSVASLGRGWYFGGHQDFLTTEGWSISIPRIYIKSLTEFTFPGFGNEQVQTLSGGKTAGTDGNWRNITQGGVQDSAGFPERADGILVYIPGFGAEGVLLGLTGGTNATFTQMNIIDVYDIATSTWYKQTTSGNTPQARVNPCAVVAAAPDGSSYNMYMYGGQNLVPYKQQIQYDDIWILSVPSFTWIQVNASGQNPPPRAGHTCNIWDGQMVVVGGYVGQDLSCDSPGIYNLNLTSLEWGNQFTALTGAQDSNNGGNNGGNNNQNPFSQQANQKDAQNATTEGLEGSYGYEVPAVVVSVIGGGPTGGATLTAPVQTPTDGPMATGKPITYTVTGPGGVITTTASPSPNSGAPTASGPNIVAIVVGVIAGILLIIAIYFAFCAWVYRKQLLLYKNHVAMAQRASLDPRTAEKEGFALPPPGVVGGAAAGAGGKTSSERDARSVAQGSHSGSSGAYASGANGVGAGVMPGGGPTGPGSNRRTSDSSSTEDLLAGQEPSFWGVKGVLLNPRRSLRVINRD